MRSIGKTRRFDKLWAMVIGAAAVAVALSASAASEMTAMEIANAIENELVYDHAVVSTDISTTVTNGIATLSGTVDNLIAKERAVDLAMTVKGVEAVVDDIAVDPAVTLSDDQIHANVEDALLRNPATESYEVMTEVDSGVATLSGTVDSWQEKELVKQVAKGVHGLTGIVDNINVNYATDRADMEIKSEITEAMRNDIHVDDQLINVNVEDGAVTLSGTVGSAAERSFALTNAWVAGVNSVNDEDLEVKLWARDDNLRETKYVARSDDEIVEAIENGLFYEPRVLTSEVLVESNAGTVTLRGDVNSLQARRAAVRVARNTVGVVDVRNRLSVEPATMSPDEEIETSIMAALAIDPYTESYQIDVEVLNGKAYLTGNVDTYFERTQADLVAAGVSGVEEVSNRLEVDTDSAPYTYDPYVDQWYPYDYVWYNDDVDYTSVKSDWVIEDNIESEIWWSPFVDSDAIEVMVDDGEAQLTGTVESWNEFWSAEENAFEGGAIAVDNDIIVDMGS